MTTFVEPKLMRKTNAIERQIAGNHYKHFTIQPVEFITKNKLSFLQGCIIKRICRYNVEGGKGIEDLKKIIHEAELIVELEGLQSDEVTHKAFEAHGDGMVQSYCGREIFLQGTVNLNSDEHDIKNPSNAGIPERYYSKARKLAERWMIDHHGKVGPVIIRLQAWNKENDPPLSEKELVSIANFTSSFYEEKKKNNVDIHA